MLRCLHLWESGLNGQGHERNLLLCPLISVTVLSNPPPILRLLQRSARVIPPFVFPVTSPLFLKESNFFQPTPKILCKQPWNHLEETWGKRREEIAYFELWGQYTEYDRESINCEVQMRTASQWKSVFCFEYVFVTIGRLPGLSQRSISTAPPRRVGRAWYQTFVLNLCFLYLIVS